MQSSAWARIREQQGWEPEFIRGERPLPCALVLWRGALGGQRLGYAPRGPVIAPDDRGGLRDISTRLATLARERGAIFLKADPELPADLAGASLREGGFIPSTQQIQPVLATLVLDLGPDEDTLFASLEKDTRWSVRQSQKRGVVIRAARDDADLRALYDLYATTGERAGFITRTWDYYRVMWGTLSEAGLATIRLAFVEERPVAGAMTWRCGERTVYQTGATNDAGRKSSAAYGLLWECIIAARREGAKRFDLGGIPVDLERKDDPMYGPYQFKRGFGGEVRRWVGAHDAVPRPLAYRAYLLAEPLYTRALRVVGQQIGAIRQ